MSRRSLFVLSLPRSLSTHVYHVARRALNLQDVGWAANGEILNHDMHALSRWPKIVDSGEAYVTRASDPRRFERCLRLLDDAAIGEGRAYKDVVNPFVISAWNGLGSFAVLKIRRDVAEVAHAMLRRGWSYPARAGRGLGGGTADAVRRLTDTRAWSALLRRVTRVSTHGRWTARLLRDDLIIGLLCAERCLERVPGISVQYSDLIESAVPLQTALRELYPDTAVEVPDYVDEEFRRGRARRLRERDGEELTRLQRDVARLRLSVARAWPDAEAEIRPSAGCPGRIGQ